MAAKRKAQPAPPPPPQSSSSEEELSEEEEEEEAQVAKPSPLKPSNSRMQAYSESESDDEPEPKETAKNPAESSEEEESDEEEEVKEAVLKPDPAKKPESQPDKKKLKSAASSSQSNGKSTRIFRPDDELALMQAVSEFHSKNNRLPTQKECESFFSSLKGKINPAITAKQLGNKVRAYRDSYYARKKKGTEPSPSANPHAKALLEISEKLWGGNVKAPKKEEGPSQDMSVDEASSNEEEHETEAINGSTINGRTVNGGTMNDGTVNGEENVKDVSEFPYLMDAIVEMSKNNQGLFLFYKNSFELMGESKARELEAKFKKLKYNQAKLVSDNTELNYKLSKELAKAGK